MLQIILFILILTTSLYSSSMVKIDTDDTNIVDFDVAYFVDYSQGMSFETAVKQQYKKASNKVSVGVGKTHLWTRILIKNTTNKPQKIYIHNENSYLLNAISFYKYTNGILLDEQSIKFKNDSISNYKDKMFGKQAVFEVELKKDEVTSIYIHTYARAFQLSHFTIHNEKHSKKALTANHNLLIIIIGVLIALSLYNLILYLTTRLKEYLYYSLYLFSGVIWESIISGILIEYFEIYYTPILDDFLISVLFILFFLILFTKSIFNTHINYPKENIILNIALFLVSLDVIIGIYDITLASKITTFIYIYSLLSLYIVTFSIIKKGNKLAIIFLIANIFFGAFATITDLYYIGILEYSPFVFSAGSIGISIEAIILSYLLSHRIKIMQKKELENTQALANEIEASRVKDKVLFQQNKMISMGEMIENIAHQWRQPLNQVNSCVLLLDEYLHEKKVFDKNIEKELLDIEKLTSYMSKTIDSFRRFFDSDKILHTFYIKDIINDSQLILNSYTKKSDVTVVINTNENYLYYGLEDEFKQVILIILNNAIDILNERGIKDKCIQINISEETNVYQINICDNAGGVNPLNLEKIFEPYFTTKHKSQGTGLGLYISKLIVEENMDGNLSLQNTDNGACFSIKLPKRQKPLFN